MSNTLTYKKTNTGNLITYANNEWAWYQAKNVRSVVYAVAGDQISDKASSQHYRDESARMKQDMDEIAKKAKALEEERDMASQDHGHITAHHRAISEALNEKRDHRTEKKSGPKRRCPMPPHFQSAESNHAGSHEEAGNGEIEEVEDADGKRKGNRHQHIDGAQHKTVN